jgi:hypothetical protein
MCKVDLESGKCTPAEARRGESNEAHKVEWLLEPGPRLESPSLWARPEPRQPFFRRYPRGNASSGLHARCAAPYTAQCHRLQPAVPRSVRASVQPLGQETATGIITSSAHSFVFETCISFFGNLGISSSFSDRGVDHAW